MPTYEVDALGNRLAALRIEHGWSQHEMAQKMGCAKSTISDLERGQRPKVSFELLRRAACLFQVSLDTLAYGAPRPSVLPQDEEGPAPASLDIRRALGSRVSIELELGEAINRRWVCQCQRCFRLWVSQAAAPKRCNYCASPYWDQPRRRMAKPSTPGRRPASGRR